MTTKYQSPVTNPQHKDYKPKGNLPKGTRPSIWALRLVSVINQYTDLHKGERRHNTEKLILITP